MLDLGKRVRRPEELENFMHQLVSADGAFTNMADAMVFAAALAYHDKLQRKPFSRTSEPISSTVFLNAGYDGFIGILAAEASGDYNVLGADRQDERVLIFEEFAHAGLEFLQGLLSGEKRPVAEVLRDLALGAYKERSPAFTPDLDHLISELDA